MAITAANPNGSWSERNIANIAECMDIAFANVLASEFDRLTSGMAPARIADWLRRSERSILRLRDRDNMPDYSDPMVVLRYVVLYQLGHINLAYTLIKGVTDNCLLTYTGRLQVADFGAGCMAMQFALTLAVADAMANDEYISRIRIDAIDTCRPMMELGVKLWREFINVAGRRNGLQFLTEAASRMYWYFNKDHHSVRKLSRTDYLVSAFHTLYNSNGSTVSSALSGLHRTTGYYDMKFIILDKTLLVHQPVSTVWRGVKRRKTPLRFLGTIDDSHAARVAFGRGFHTADWSVPKLYSQEIPARAAKTYGVANVAGGCLLPALGAALFGAAGVVGIVWLGVLLLG